MPATLKITINQNDWNDQLKGWNCNALSVSCLAVVSVRVNGVSPDPSFYVLEKENNLIRWTQPQRPEELVLLVKPIIDEQEDTEKSKQVKLDTVLKFAAVVIPALIAAVSTITVTIINTKKDNNTEQIQKLNQDNKMLAEESAQLYLDGKKRQAILDSLKRATDSLSNLLHKNINKQIEIDNALLKKEIAKLKEENKSLKNKQKEQPKPPPESNRDYTVIIQSSKPSNEFSTLQKKLEEALFLEVKHNRLSATQNRIIFYHAKAKESAQNAARLFSQYYGLQEMIPELIPIATRANEIQIQIK